MTSAVGIGDHSLWQAHQTTRPDAYGKTADMGGFATFLEEAD
jgi:hypothetical protein